jgi:hypothetical protein
MKDLERFVSIIKENDGIGNKTKLIKTINESFDFTNDRSIYYCKTFAVRYSQSKTGSFSNTVLSLSKLQKYDHIPVIICLVTKTKNKLFLANSTFLVKISHSSKDFTSSNIRGSFNGSDILKSFNGILNTRNNILRLFAFHVEIGFSGNLDRLVEATNNIVPTGTKFEVNSDNNQYILNAPSRALKFSKSGNEKKLKKELDLRLKKYQNEIIIAGHIENVNIRGRLIEYLICEDDNEEKAKLVRKIEDEYSNLPRFSTENSLGDFKRTFDNTLSETDIKTKIMLQNSNPKAYNIDKFLEFLSQNNTVFLFYFIGLDAEKIVNTTLVSVFQKDLVRSTFIHGHWSGRNSRGTAQFDGNTIHRLILNPINNIDIQFSNDFLQKLIER